MRDCFLWAHNDAAKEAFHTGVSFVDIDKLLLSEELKAFLRETGSLYDCSINWEYPPDPKDWPPEMAAEFDHRAHEAYHRICAELGEDYEIIYAV